MKDDKPAAAGGVDVRAGDGYVCPYRGGVATPPGVRMIARLCGLTARECWPWPGHIDREGYGEVSYRDASMRTHRVMYEMVFGRVPEGLVLDHTCKNKGCCNPLHLEPVSIGDNVRRGFGGTDTHFGCGHPRTSENMLKRGHCKMCNVVRQREYKARSRARLKA